jgi:hypothetical protein
VSSNEVLVPATNPTTGAPRRAPIARPKFSATPIARIRKPLELLHVGDDAVVAKAA